MNPLTLEPQHHLHGPFSTPAAHAHTPQAPSQQIPFCVAHVSTFISSYIPGSSHLHSPPRRVSSFRVTKGSSPVKGSSRLLLELLMQAQGSHESIFQPPASPTAIACNPIPGSLAFGSSSTCLRLQICFPPPRQGPGHTPTETNKTRRNLALE